MRRLDRQFTRQERNLPQLHEIKAEQICDRVVAQFGMVSPGYLVDITHAEGGPWHFVVTNARTGPNLGLRISDRIIAERHTKLKVSIKQSSKTGESSEESPFVGNRSRKDWSS